MAIYVCGCNCTEEINFLGCTTRICSGATSFLIYIYDLPNRNITNLDQLFLRYRYTIVVVVFLSFSFRHSVFISPFFYSNWLYFWQVGYVLENCYFLHRLFKLYVQVSSLFFSQQLFGVPSVYSVLSWSEPLRFHFDSRSVLCGSWWRSWRMVFNSIISWAV